MDSFIGFNEGYKNCQNNRLRSDPTSAIQLFKYSSISNAMSSKSSKIESDKPLKVNKWDGNAVKNALDDAVRDILTKKYNYVESFGLIDGRLCICSVAVLVALFALLWDWLYPFPQSKPVLIVCVSTYFALMFLITLYTTYREQGIFAVAVQKDPAGFLPDNTWQASSSLKKYDDKYHLQLVMKDGKSGFLRTGTFIRSIANFIDEGGVIILELLEPEVWKLHNSLLIEKKEK